MYKTTINYFKQNGDQEIKVLERKTVNGLMNAIKKFDENNEIYYINRISRNLVDNKIFNEYTNTLGWK